MFEETEKEILKQKGKEGLFPCFQKEELNLLSDLTHVPGVTSQFTYRVSENEGGKQFSECQVCSFSFLAEQQKHTLFLIA